MGTVTNFPFLSERRNSSTLLICLLLAAGHALAQPSPAAPDARAIILRSAERDQNDLAARRNYTFLTYTEQRNLDAAGTVQKVEGRTQPPADTRAPG